MAIKFLSDIDVTGSYNLQASDIPDISGTYATIAYITAQGFLTTLPAHNHDDRYYTKSQSDSKYLLVGGETDPIFLASPAYGITAQKITNWDTAFGWGDHSSSGYITEAVGNTLYQPIGNYDNYGSWNLKTNSVQRTTVQSGGTLDIIAGTNVTVSYSAGGKVTIASTDTNTTYSAGTGLTLTGTTFAVGNLSGTYSTVGHTHPIEEIDGLQDVLDGKADIGHTHSYLPLAGGTVTGNLTLGNQADLVFSDLSGTFPTSGKGFDWTLNNDGARIYAVQPSSDSIDLVFQLRDNATTNDRFVFHVKEWQGASYDKYPLIIRGGTQFDLVDSALYVANTQVISNARVLSNVSGNISMFTNDSNYATTQDVTDAISNLVDAAPGTLNTLNELAAALGDDPNFATTITTAIGGKADASHTHEISDINNLQTELDGKQPVGSYAAASHNHDDRYYTETESDLRYSIYRGALGTSNDVGSTTGWANNLKAGTYIRNYTGHSGQVLVSHDTGGSVGNIALEATYNGSMYVHTNVDSNAWLTKQIWTSYNFTSTNISNWNTAFGWGNHAGLYAAASHTHSEYLKYNPDGDGIVISYDDSNPNINGVAVGGGHWFGADGDTAGGYLAARVLHAQGITSSISGYYVGAMDISAGGNSTAVIDGYGNWVGVSIPDNKIASSANWNTAYGWGNHAGLYGSAGDTAKGVEAFGWGNHANAGYLTSVTNISGNAATATKLQTARTIALSGDVSGSATFDGSGNITISTEVANDSHSHTILSALGDYVFNAGTNGRNFSRGIQTSFVSASQSYPDYGSVMRIATYSGLNDGGTAEMYFPYSPTYGGDTIRYRLGLYNNAGWSQWFNVASREWVTAQGFAAGTHQHDGGDIVSGTIAAERIADLSGTYAVADHTHSYLPLSGGTLTGDVTTSGNIKGANLQLSGATPTLYFNGTNDGGDYTSSDMAIKATPEGLDFYEPEDGNKIHFQILDDLGVNSPFGYQWNGQSLDTRYAASSHTHTFASLTSKPTTLSGYGITDAASSTHTHDALYWRKATMETQNPVGVTYGQGVSSVPPYYIGQLTGDNDGWRIYGEAPSTNDVKVIFEVIDDLEAGDTWVFRNKQTYSPYLATEAFIIEGNGNIKANGTVTATGGNSTQWNTAYGWGNHGAAGYATPQDITDAINNLVDGAPAALDTLNELAAAINDNASYASTVTTALSGKVAKSGDTMTGDLTMSGDNKVVFGPNSGWGKYLIIGGGGNNSTANHASIGVTNGNLHIDAAISHATYLNYYDGTAGVAFGSGAGGIVAWMGPDGDLWKGGSDNNGNKYWHAGDFANNSSNWDTAFGWGNHATAGYGSAGDTAKGVEAFGWGNHANAGYQDAASAITTSNIGSQSVSYATSASAAGYSNLLLREDNRTISPSELGAAYMKFGFTSWNNNNTAPYADFLHLRSYTDSSGGNDNLVMFKKSGIGMRIWQQSWGSASAYSSYADVWTSADFSSTNVGNWNTAYGWGNHANAGYLTSLGTAILDGDFTSNGLMKRTGAGTYAVVTDNSSNWNTAYGWGNHAGLYAASTHQHDASAIVSGQFAAELIPDLSGTYAVASHFHSAGDITSGTLNAARLPKPTSGNWWNGGAIVVGTDGVMEVGKYMDWHETNAGTSDYDYRMYVSSGRMYMSGDLEIDGGDLYISDGNTRLHKGNSNMLRVTTNSGYIEIGPANTSHCHIQTDRSNFYFDKEIRVNSGIIGSYDEDLQLRRANVNKIYVADDTTTSYNHFVPDADRTKNLGTDALRWQIIFCETLDSAGLHEANLASRKTGFYATGTVLVWKDGEAVPCTDFADYMKIGIAVYGNPSPLVQGAEPVLCTGEVNEGDYLVTSQTEGHAIAMSRKEVKEQDIMDCVIGKALESGNGESHLIKTWVNI